MSALCGDLEEGGITLGMGKRHMNLEIPSEFEKNTPHDEKSIKTVADVKVASVMHRDRSTLAVLCGLLCISYVTLYQITASIWWVIFAIAAGIALVWFAMTSASAKEFMKKAVLSLEETSDFSKGVNR